MSSLKIKPKKAIAISILFFLLILFLSIYISKDELYLSNYTWSIFFTSIVVLIYILRFTNSVPLSNLYSIFFISFLLFIGGRFIATLLNPQSDTFFLDFFITYRLNDFEITQLMMTIFISMISMELGSYLAYTSKSNSINPSHITEENKPSKYIIIVCLSVIFLLTLLQIKNNLELVSKLGYIALYASQSEAIQASWSSLLITFTYVFLGITLVHSTRRIKLLYLTLFGLSCLTQAFIGVRGALVIYLLFLIWVMNDYGKKKPNLLFIIPFMILIAGFVTYIIPMFSMRHLSEEESFLIQISDFFYSQGTSLMIFDASTKLESYSAIPVLQSFIPGSSFLIGLISHELPSYYISFGRYLSYQLNPSLYNQGFGTGWSLLSDFHVFSGGVIVIFSLYNFIWGFFINKLEVLSNHNQTYKRILITIAPSVIFIPRAGISSIIPLIIYATIIYTLISTSKRKQKKQ
ncbi:MULTISPECIES: O-antigen polysaccharide polymerase Wzy [Vitreoscilla]|uniref:O-antigen polysaccharide polymerase Wzy family protein n=1 Tax=Vitreoscilla stercoraria TaxID=61 RepID=A0ABY4E9U7_VITST|nr:MULTISPECIES: O-antigen polysaccharide polymerase Wzy [Vitreoscilla]AUZ04143.2 putative O-antigen polysaccharide polymerase Wzy [Vitreoscilla sp. C1]UOO92091.1 O-antigen polysaccharide polymerase Wzy family protein [Vitreoscilla stercoraria]